MDNERQLLQRFYTLHRRFDVLQQHLLKMLGEINDELFALERELAHISASKEPDQS